MIALMESSRFLKSLGFSSLILLIGGSWQLALAVLTFLLFSYLFNDVVDADMDQLAHPERAIPSGRLTLTTATITALALAFTTIYLLPIAVWCLIASAVYSWPLKRYYPLVATWFWVSSVVGMVALTTEANSYILLIFFVGLTWHEMLLDLRDQKTDQVFAKTQTWATFAEGKMVAAFGILYLVLVSFYLDGFALFFINSDRFWQEILLIQIFGIIQVTNFLSFKLNKKPKEQASNFKKSLASLVVVA